VRSGCRLARFPKLCVVISAPPIPAATTLTATADGVYIAYTWAFGDGDSGSGGVVAHTYPAIGVYTATITATNSVDIVTATTTVTVDEAIAGLAATNDSPTEVGDATTLTATITAHSRRHRHQLCRLRHSQHHRHRRVSYLPATGAAQLLAALSTF
jgi:hypothetical protein